MSPYCAKLNLDVRFSISSAFCSSNVKASCGLSLRRAPRASRRSGGECGRSRSHRPQRTSPLTTLSTGTLILGVSRRISLLIGVRTLTCSHTCTHTRAHAHARCRRHFSHRQRSSEDRRFWIERRPLQCAGTSSAWIGSGPPPRNAARR